MRWNLNAWCTLINLSLLGSTTAIPVDILSTLTCHCISFSPTNNPMPCPLANSQNLNWDTARNLASQHQLNIQFATQDTASQVLEVATPLPTSVLLSMSNDKPLPLDHTGALESVQRIVCGIDDDLRQLWMAMSERQGGESDYFVLQIILSLILLIILYEVGEVAWTSMFPEESPIRLSGSEKLLRVDLDARAMRH